MTEPDRLSALSQRVTALTGRTLPRDELVIVAGRAFEHQIDLDDDGQLRALVGGLSSGGGHSADRRCRMGNRRCPAIRRAIRSPVGPVPQWRPGIP